MGRVRAGGSDNHVTRPSQVGLLSTAFLTVLSFLKHSHMDNAPCSCLRGHSDSQICMNSGCGVKSSTISCRDSLLLLGSEVSAKETTGI